MGNRQVDVRLAWWPRNSPIHDIRLPIGHLLALPVHSTTRGSHLELAQRICSRSVTV